MEQKLFEGYTQEKRVQMLKDNCYQAEVLDYDKVIPEFELQGMRSRIVVLCREIETKEDEKKETMKELSDEIKGLSDERRSLVRKVTKGKEEHTETCYKFIEDGKAWYYNGEGELVYSRMAMPNEMQTVMFADFAKDGTND